MSRLDRRQVLRMLGAVAAAGAAGGCATQGLPEAAATPPGKRIRVGVLAPRSGRYEAIGRDIASGFRVYLEANGGRLGASEVDITEVDEGTSPDTARKAVEQLVSSGMTAIVGGADSASVTAIRDLVEKARIPFVGTNGSPSDLTSVYYMWRVSYVDGEAGRAIAPRLYRDHKSVYVISDDTPAAQAEANNFRRVYTQLGGSVVSEVIATDGYANRIRAAGSSPAPAVFASYSGAAASAFIGEFASARTGKPLFGPGALTEGIDVDRLMDGDSAPPQILTAMNYAPNLNNDDNRRFSTLYKRTVDRQPNAYSMAAYDAAAVIDAALRLLGNDASPAGLNLAFSKLGRIDSPRGSWTFTVNRTPQQRWYLRRLRRDGQVPANLADEDLDVPT